MAARIRVTRVAYNPDAWETAPRRLAADGRIIRLGWSRSIDPQILGLTGDTTRSRLDLLVVPADAPAAAAGQAFTAASDRANRRTPTAELAPQHQAAEPVPPSRQAVDRVPARNAAPAGTAATAVWDSERGPPAQLKVTVDCRVDASNMHTTTAAPGSQPRHGAVDSRGQHRDAAAGAWHQRRTGTAARAAPRSPSRSIRARGRSPPAGPSDPA
ncbi:DUF5994 family protein [Geodermatophilus sp. SYSU D00703]